MGSCDSAGRRWPTMRARACASGARPRWPASRGSLDRTRHPVRASRRRSAFHATRHRPPTGANASTRVRRRTVAPCARSQASAGKGSSCASGRCGSSRSEASRAPNRLSRITARKTCGAGLGRRACSARRRTAARSGGAARGRSARGAAAASTVSDGGQRKPRRLPSQRHRDAPTACRPGRSRARPAARAPRRAGAAPWATARSPRRPA